MSGIRKCLLNREKKFLIFLKRAGFPLRFFAYVGPVIGNSVISYQLLQKIPDKKPLKNRLFTQKIGI